MLVNITSTILVNPKFISHIECVERPGNPHDEYPTHPYPAYIITMIDGKKFELHRTFDYPNEAYPLYALGDVLLAKIQEGM